MDKEYVPTMFDSYVPHEPREDRYWCDACKTGGKLENKAAHHRGRKHIANTTKK